MKIVFLAYDCNTTFITNEILFMLRSPKVTRLYIYTDLPIVNEEINNNNKSSILVFGKIQHTVIKIPFLKIAITELFSNLFWYLRHKDLKEFLFTFYNLLKKAYYIKEYHIPEGAILYAYWAGSEAFIISCLKESGLENLALSRMHGFDLYEEGNNHGYIPWRKFILNRLDYLLPISHNGKIYLSSKYPFIEKKINVFNIGIYFKNMVLNLSNDSDMYHVVSCAWVGEHKNLKGIYEAIKSQKYWEWTHIGDGEYLNTLNNQICLDSLKLIKVNLIGRLNTDQINTFYREKKITCFISLSPNEGLPVSMMEAQAFGIPIVSTDVGGCSEIVTPETGLLLPKNYTDADVVNAVRYCAEKFSSPESRQRIQDFCKEKFSAEKNYESFLDFLDEENQKHLQKYT